MPVYLDCNATTPLEPRVRDKVIEYMTEEFGNAGSRTHDYGARAKKAVERARVTVATAVDASKEEVIFTSGATESNNIAILGLAAHGEKTGRKHLISTKLEHKAVLEPFERLQERGFEVDFLTPNSGGYVEPTKIADALRPDTLLVSIMQVNNETGIRQPIGEVAEVLADSESFFHVDAAQGFGKDIGTLRNDRLDLISISGHKLYAPKGVGALVMRRKNYRLPPLSPLAVGGGQERKLRPGTLPVQLVVGLGEATRISLEDHEERERANAEYRKKVLEALMPLEPRLNGDQSRCMSHVLNLAFDGVDSEALMVALKGHIAISNGSACTSKEYTPSHVLRAMDAPEWVVDGAVRISWCHMTPEVDWEAVRSRISGLR